MSSIRSHDSDSTQRVASDNQSTGQEHDAVLPFIHIISCGIDFPKDTELLNLISEADVVFGSRTLIEHSPIALAKTRSIAKHPRDDARTILGLCRMGQRVVVLASGDALYNGFGGTLARIARDSNMEQCLRFHAGTTAFQQLFHKLGMAWQEAQLFSVHGGDALPLRTFHETPFSVIYAGSRHTAADIAKALCAFHSSAASRQAILAQSLGTENESIEQGTLVELAERPCVATSILVLLPYPITATSSLPLPLGLPEDFYVRENNLITASDSRAIILSRLRLPASGLLWDVGAGSGSVGLEAAALRPSLTVVGIERKEERGTMIEANRKQLGITNYKHIIGEALTTIDALADTPDRIFIGGGGRDLAAILDRCMERLAPQGLLIASAVTLESLQTLLLWRPDLRDDVTSIQIAKEHTLAGHYHHLRQQHILYVITYSKRV